MGSRDNKGIPVGYHRANTSKRVAETTRVTKEATTGPSPPNKWPRQPGPLRRLPSDKHHQTGGRDNRGHQGDYHRVTTIKRVAEKTRTIKEATNGPLQQNGWPRQPWQPRRLPLDKHQQKCGRDNQGHPGYYHRVKTTELMAEKTRTIRETTTGPSPTNGWSKTRTIKEVTTGPSPPNGWQR